jgi:hypothetical protein
VCAANNNIINRGGGDWATRKCRDSSSRRAPHKFCGRENHFCGAGDALAGLIKYVVLFDSTRNAEESQSRRDFPAAGATTFGVM